MGFFEFSLGVVMPSFYLAAKFTGDEPGSIYWSFSDFIGEKTLCLLAKLDEERALIFEGMYEDSWFWCPMKAFFYTSTSAKAEGALSSVYCLKKLLQSIDWRLESTT